jgi:uncharacterized membrane protein YphA (DoxX/SURF4 family)
MALDPAIGWMMVLAYALLLLPAAWHKARDLPVFAAVLGAYRILPRPLTPLMAPLVPLFEVMLALGLLLSPARVQCAWALSGLLLVYAAAIGVNIARGRTDLDCGCTGPLERRPVASWMIYRNLLLAGNALLLSLRWSDRPLTLLDGFAVAAALTTIIFLWLAVDRLLGQVVPRGTLLKAFR